VSWPVLVEVVLLRLGPDGHLEHRTVASELASPSDVDDHALALSGGLASDAVLHSTSWRQEQGRLVLTYAALPDPNPAAPAQSLVAPSVVAGSTSLRPSPDVLHAHHVAAHAVRHLADLAERDPVVTAAAAQQPQLWAEVTRTARRTPTGTHDVVHALAEGSVEP
jgi:hypothetical protein